MSDSAPPTDPFAQPPQAPPAAATPATSAKKPPWKLIVGAAVVVVAVVVGVVVFTGGDDDSGTSDPGGGGGTAVAGEWHLVRYGDTLTVLDTDGSSPRTVEMPAQFEASLAPATGRWLLGENDGGFVEVVDLNGGAATTIELPSSDLGADRFTLAGGGDDVVFMSPAGGPLVLANLATGAVQEIGSSERGYFPAGARPGFSLFVAFDGSTTVLVPQADPTAWWEVAGGVGDVRGADVLTLGPSGDEYVARRFARDQQEGEAVVFSVPVLGGLFTETGGTVIDTGGGVWAVDFGDGSKESLGTLGIGVDVVVPIATDRLLAWGGSGTAVVLADGTTAQKVDPVPDADGEEQPLMLVPGGLGSKCITLQPGQQMRMEKARAITIDSASGEELARFEATPYGFSTDGCSAFTAATPSEVMLDGALLALDPAIVRVFVLSPDHTQLIGGIEGADGIEFVLVDVASGAQTPIEQGAYFYAKF